MAKKVKGYLSAAAISLLCGALFFAIGYLYLSGSARQVEKKESRIEYAQNCPDNAGIMIEINESKTLIFFDFQQQSISILNADEKTVSEGECCGYSVDYTLSADHSFLGGLVGRIGGIELETENGVLSFSGIQIENLLGNTVDKTVLRCEIIEGIFKKISHIGFSQNDFAYIIENSETSLTIPDCYYWCDYIKNMCQKTYFVN